MFTDDVQAAHLPKHSGPARNQRLTLESVQLGECYTSDQKKIASKNRFMEVTLC
jgi:hypothetical protein